MEYRNTITITGETQSVLKTAMQMLMAQGFSVLKREEQYLELQGLNAHSSNQNALLGASKVTISATGQRIVVSAELKGYDNLIKILSIMMVVMAIGFGLMAYFLPNEDSSYNPLYAVLPLLPWVFLMPFLAKIFKKRTVKALDILVANLAVLGSS